MMRYFYHTNNKNDVLAHSHYSDPAYDGDGAVIFGKNRNGLSFVYDDRLRQWDYDKHKMSWAIAVENHSKNTAARIERYLQEYFDDPFLEIEVIITGTRPFDGYPWYAYGYSSND